MDFYKDINGYFVIGAGRYPTGLYYSRFRENGNIDIIPVNGSDSLPSYNNIAMSSLRKADGSYYIDSLEVASVIGEMTIGIPTPLIVNGQSVSDSNPLPTFSADSAGRNAANTIFSDTIIGKRVPQISAQFQYPITQDGVASTVANGGTYLQENSMLKLRTDSQIGSSVELHSTDNIRYIPGFEVYALFTTGFNAPVEGQDQFMGLLDDETGFGIGYHGLDFMFIHRRGGVNNYYPIDLTYYNEKAGYTFNPQMGNIYRLTFGYLGFAPATLEVLDPNNTNRVLHKFPYPNSATETHISQTFLPVRAELNNNEGSTPMEIFIGSINAGIVDGSGCSEYEFARFFNYATNIPYTITESTALTAFRVKSDFGSIPNQVESRLALISGAADLSKTSRWFAIKNPVITNTPTWTDVDIDSTVEYSNDVVIDFVNSNTYFLTWTLSKAGTFIEYVDRLQMDLKPGEVACFYLATTGTGEVDLAINWWELF